MMTVPRFCAYYYLRIMLILMHIEKRCAKQGSLATNK